MKWVIFAWWVSWRSNFEGPFVITAFLAGTEAAHVSTSQIGNAHVCAYVWRQHMHRPARNRKCTCVYICVEEAHVSSSQRQEVHVCVHRCGDRKCICVCLCVCALCIFWPPCFYKTTHVSLTCSILRTSANHNHFPGASPLNSMD